MICSTVFSAFLLSFFGADMRFLCCGTSDFETVNFGNVRGFCGFLRNLRCGTDRANALPEVTVTG